MPDHAMCPHTHPFLTSGTCPWCEQPILNGQVRADLSARAAGVRKWNTQAMMAALDSQETETRTRVVDNLSSSGPAATDAMPVFQKAVADCDPQVRTKAVSALMYYGIKLLPVRPKTSNDVPMNSRMMWPFTGFSPALTLYRPGPQNQLSGRGKNTFCGLSSTRRK
jgi:hypothetical protein